MLLAQALHTASRRYCQERSNYWHQYCTQLRQTRNCKPNNYQKSLLEGYARSKILNIICSEIERLNYDELNEIEDTRKRILSIGRVAQEAPLRPNMGQTSTPKIFRAKLLVSTEDVVLQERELFCTYIAEISESQLLSTQPLPYQRVLSPDESAILWQKLRSQWKIIGYRWYPLFNCNLSNITAFNADAFEEFCSTYSLIDILLSRNIGRIWELREYGIEYEQNVSLFDPAYNGYEGYWTSDDFDWIIYASHEDSITVGGWLLDIIKSRWQDWQRNTW